MASPILGHFKHLSVSNVNAFAEYRPQWLMERVFNLRTPMSPKAYVGRAVEHGIAVSVQHQVKLEAAIGAAVDLYNEETAGDDVDEADQFREVIAPLVEAGIEQIKPIIASYGPVNRTQGRIDLDQLPGLPGIPWLGYTDFELGANHECRHIVDCKVTWRTPSVIKPAWVRQGSLYRYARKTDVTFLTLIPLKSGVKTTSFVVDNHDSGIKELVAYARAMDTALTLPREQLAALYTPSRDDWWLKDEMAQSLAKEVWPDLMAA